MSTRHRWLAVYLSLAVCFPIPISRSFAGNSESGQPSGPVGLRELIALALKNDPVLVALRHEITIEEARKRAARQWRDPEVRVGYSQDGNIQLDEPYSRHGTVTETFSGNGKRSDSGSGGAASESSRSTERRTTSFTEKVIPGADSDRIIRTETERRNTTTNTEGNSDKGPSNQSRSETETFRSTSDETRYDSRDPFAEDNSASVRIRFWIPNPWEMKELVNQAAKEVDLASFKVKEAERNVVLRVREEYEKLQYLYKRYKAQDSKIVIIQKHVDRENALLEGGGEFTIDQLNFEEITIPALIMARDSAKMELDAAKRELAARVGLADGSRIRVTDKLLRTTIDLQSADLDYLTRMAFAFRGELGILKHEQAIAESELALVKSKRIPWFSFIEAAYARDRTGSYHTNDEYGVQFGVVLPLFSWLGKDEAVVEARIQSYYASLAANQKNIANEVGEAFRSVKEAARGRKRVDAAIDTYGRKLEAVAKRLDASEDLAAKEQLRYDVEIQRDEFRKYILNADRLYNQSLIRLERALGADLDQVFSVEFEKLAGSTATGETIEAAAESSSHPDAPRAMPVPTPIELESQKAPKGILSRLFRPDPNRKPQKKVARRGFSNR